MSLFDNLSSLLEWTASKDKGDSDLRLDEVAPLNDSNISAPLSPQLAPSTRLFSLKSPAAPTKDKKRGNSVRAQILALSMFDEQSPTLNFNTIQLRTSVFKLSVYKLRTKAILRK
jgi:hypothetical protein